MAQAYSDKQLKLAVTEVCNAFSYKLLQERCQQSKKSLFHALDGKIVGPKSDRYAFKDNGADILMVSHLDTVQQGTTFAIVKYPGETLVFNPRLDDRLGVYTILDLMPALGVKADILFSDNEECGRTTAAHFNSDKQYNWIASFDRRGEDVVTYQYTWDATLRDYFTVGHGSFSCIGKLDELGCQAVNIGVGYQNEHSHRAYFIVQEYIRNVARFLLFYRAMHATHFKYKPVKYELPAQSWNGRQRAGFVRSEGTRDCVKCKKSTHLRLHTANIKDSFPMCYDCIKGLGSEFCSTCYKWYLSTSIAVNEATGRMQCFNCGPRPAPKACTVVGKSRISLLNDCPDAIAFCDMCWEAKTGKDTLGSSVSDAVLCGSCGSVLEVFVK